MGTIKKVSCFAPLTACLICPTPSIGADVPKEGNYDVRVGCSGPSQVLTGVKDHMGGSYLVTCMPDAAEGAFFNGVVVQCTGSWTLVTGNYEEHGMCEATDQSGDKYFGVYTKSGQSDGVWRVTGGTGKYEGMQHSGAFNMAIQKPSIPGQGGGVFHWWGNYKMG